LYGEAEVWDQPLQTGQLNLVQAIRDFWPSGITSVLDVGCGDGKLTSRLQAPGAPTIVGLDSSAEALSRLPFDSVLADAQAMPFPNGAFDLVMSTDTLEHMPDAEEANAWGELFRVAGKVVLVAVPFREELLDATARCANCGHPYHVNWHQRRYDIADLQQRAPTGWRVRATVLAGEPWSAMLPPETLLRRRALGEWSGWELALCPHCGSSGQAVAAEQPLQPLLAQALAKQLYPALAEQRYCRSHSEILLVFQRDGVAVKLPTPSLVEGKAQPASRVDFDQQPVAANLSSFCQVAQRVVGVDGRWRLQFPLYDGTPTLEVRRQPGSSGPLHLMLEDSVGSLLDGCVLAAGQDSNVLELPRPPLAGYYGILASCATDQPFATLQLGQSPSVLWAVGGSAACSYLPLNVDANPLFVQVTQQLWFDPETLAQPPAVIEPTPGQVLNGLQACFEGALHRDSAYMLSEAQAAEMNQLREHIQDLSAERDALLSSATDANRLAVQLQNLGAERDALQQQAADAERVAVQLQNLSAERDALQQRALEADQLLVQLQNLSAERDALQARAVEAGRLAVTVQNLSAEHDALQQRALEADQLLVQLQNLSAERDALQARAVEADRLAVTVQNLSAERDALQQRALEADQLLVQLQNLSAERDVLQARAVEAGRLAVTVQNLSAERDALLQRASEADSLAVQVQNLNAERDALLQRTAAVDQLAVQLQNLEAERTAFMAHAQAQTEKLHEQDQHFQSRSSEAQAQLQEALTRLAQQEAHNQHLYEQLRNNQARLAQLNQHMETRVGTVVRNTLASLVNKK